MQNDAVLHNMPADTKFFIYQGATLAYSPDTGMCWRVNSQRGNWNLITPGTASKGYTVLKIGGRTRKLHRIIAEVFLNAGKPLTAQQEVDHKEHADGTHWQDRLSNLRICSSRENARNRALRWGNNSGYKGVGWHESTNKWAARVNISGRNQYLGYFTTPESAAQAYDAAAIQHFGEFALTNEKLGLFNPRRERLGLMQVF